MDSLIRQLKDGAMVNDKGVDLLSCDTCNEKQALFPPTALQGPQIATEQTSDINPPYASLPNERHVNERVVVCG